MMGKLPILLLTVTMGPFVTIGTFGTVTKSASGTLVMLAAMGGRVGGRNNYLRFQRGDQGPDREGGRAGAGVAPGQIIPRLSYLAKNVLAKGLFSLGPSFWMGLICKWNWTDYVRHHFKDALSTARRLHRCI